MAWKARRVSSTGLTYPAMRDLTILPIHKRMKAKSFHHRPADPKPVEPTHGQVRLLVALQARQRLLIGATARRRMGRRG
jgi:hypothetical protein